ncbi:VPA1267 family protein [Neptuniibacter sp.]|uniref:VPA1267 family protein n=1 Tax=Neptuniibacter sp. TaxID=1962643 RepID=UPI003B599B89
MSRSSQQKKRESVRAFLRWHDAVGEEGIKEYIRRGQLNRSLIAQELGFARSAWGSNPRLKKALSGAESRLMQKGIIGEKASTVEINTRDRNEIQNQKDRRRLQSLEQQNAALQAELTEAKNKLKELNVFEEFLAETSRVPR